MIRCVKCSKEAEYTVNGQSVCKEHRGDKEETKGISMGERMVMGSI